MDKLYPLSLAYAGSGKQLVQTEKLSRTHSSMGPSAFPLDVALRPEVEAKANVYASLILRKSIGTARVIPTTSPRM